jgi:hypothetical protein
MRDLSIKGRVRVRVGLVAVAEVGVVGIGAEA